MHVSRTAALALAGAAMALTTVHAFHVSGSAPGVHFKGISDPRFTPAMQAYFEDKMNAEVKDAFDKTIDTANAKLSQFESQKQLAQGMGNANAYATNSATLQGFQNYDLFAVSSGIMMGVQGPSLDPTVYKHLQDKIAKDGDLYAGFGAGLTELNVGLNCKFLVPGLYLNAKFGTFKMKISDFSIDNQVFGVGANYRLLDKRSFVGLVKWRGISLGSGFYMQMDKVDMQVPVKTFENDAHLRQAVLSGTTGQDSTDKEAILDQMGYGAGTPDAQVAIHPVFKMAVDVTTYTVPLEANTAVALLFGLINLSAGVGADLNFGNAKIKLEGQSDADITGNSDKVTFDAAKVNVEGSSSNGPSLMRLRAMTGVGLGFGPVKLDIPLVYYFNSGVAFGATVAVVW
jgi:hypothetical protein